jgi:hypothetical protein
MRKGKMARAYLDGFGTVRSILDLDELTAEEVLEALLAESDPQPGLTPWKRGFNAAIRVALGHPA